MERVRRVEDFLRLISEISKNGILIDSNLVYSNLINAESKEPIWYYFTLWLEKYGVSRKIHASKDDHYCRFKSYNAIPNYKKIKMYIPLDLSRIYSGVNDLLGFLYETDIEFESKVSRYTRLDDVSLEVGSVEDARRVREFIRHNNYGRGIMNSNLFAFGDGLVSLVWDGKLLYNMVVSNYIASYINYMKDSNNLNNVSFDSFYNYVMTVYSDVFIYGKGINEFAEKNKLKDYLSELVDYQSITELLMSALDKESTIEDFYSNYLTITSDESIESKRTRISSLLEKDRDSVEYTPEQEELFDLIFIKIAKDRGLNYAVQTFRVFSYSGNFRVFTRRNNIRHLMLEGMTPRVANELLLEEQQKALSDAFTKTNDKYGSIQAARALFSLKNGDYSAFTNEENVRSRLQCMVKPGELGRLIHMSLTDKIELPSAEDEIWAYVEINSIRENTK